MWVIKNKHGFTVVETFIVLGVTSGMFLATVLMVSGQIGKYQYSAAMQQTGYFVRDVINDVQTGYYPDVPRTLCGAAATGASNCTIVGKKITFQANQAIIETLATNVDGPPAVANIITDPSLTEIKPYPGGLDKSFPATDFSVVIKYNNFPITTPGVIPEFRSGAQSVSLTQDGGPNWGLPFQAADARTVCFSDGKRKGSVAFQPFGSTEVVLNIEDSSC